MHIYLENSAQSRINPSLQKQKSINKRNSVNINTNYLNLNNYSSNQDISFGKIIDPLKRISTKATELITPEIKRTSRRIIYFDRGKEIPVPEINGVESLKIIFNRESGYSHSEQDIYAITNNQTFTIGKINLPDQKFSITVQDSPIKSKNSVTIDEISAKECRLNGNKLKVNKSIQGEGTVRIGEWYTSKGLEEISSTKGTVYVFNKSNELTSAKIIKAGESVKANVEAETINAGNCIELSGKSIVDNTNSKIAYLKDSVVINKSVDSESLMIEDNVSIGLNNAATIKTNDMLIKGNDVNINGNIIIRAGKNPHVIIDSDIPGTIINGLIQFENKGTLFVKKGVDTAKIRVKNGIIKQLSNNTMDIKVHKFEKRMAKNGAYDLTERVINQERNQNTIRAGLDESVTLLERIKIKGDRAAKQ